MTTQHYGIASAAEPRPAGNHPPLARWADGVTCSGTSGPSLDWRSDWRTAPAVVEREEEWGGGGGERTGEEVSCFSSLFQSIVPGRSRGSRRNQWELLDQLLGAAACSWCWFTPALVCFSLLLAVFPPRKALLTNKLEQQATSPEEPGPGPSWDRGQSPAPRS